MSLTLQQSCRLYEREARRMPTTPPSLKDFNAAHDATLPTSSKALRIHKRFVKALERQKKIHGVPVSAPLPSFYRALCAESDGELPPQRFSNVAAAAPAAPAQVRKAAPEIGAVPEVEHVFQAPEAELEPPSLEEAALAALDDEDPVHAYRTSLDAWMDEHPESKLHKNSQVVHFVGASADFAPERTAAKLTRNTGATLKAHGGEFKMRDGSKRVIEGLVAEDVKAVIQDMRNNVKGPYFVRVM